MDFDNDQIEKFTYEKYFQTTWRPSHAKQSHSFYTSPWEYLKKIIIKTLQENLAFFSVTSIT